jgi:uncharacterized membrane protein
MSGEFITLVLGRWLHIMAGVMWIGLLYYFNFVQVDALKAAAADTPPSGGGITKHVAPRALFYFRYAALVTVLAGLMMMGSRTVDVLTLRAPYVGLGIGVWLGIIMFVNVWMVIWPNQKRVLGLTPASDEEKARARRTAFLASRTNTMLSIPLLLFMSTSYTLHRPLFGG